MSRSRRRRPGQVGPEVREVGGDRQLGVGDGVEALGLAAVAGPEDLGQGDGGGEVDVGEDAEDHGKMAAVAQPHRPRGAGRLVALGFVVPFHIGLQVPFPGVGAGGPVVGDLVGGQEQRGDGVHEGRLARAVAATASPSRGMSLLSSSSGWHVLKLDARGSEQTVQYDEDRQRVPRLSEAMLPRRLKGGRVWGSRRGRRSSARRRSGSSSAP